MHALYIALGFFPLGIWKKQLYAYTFTQQMLVYLFLYSKMFLVGFEKVEMSNRQRNRKKIKSFDGSSLVGLW